MARQIRFGDWHFYPYTGVLEREGAAVSLEPLVASLLEYFLDHTGELLSRDQLIAEVWEGRVVSDDAIRRAVSSLRRALILDGSDKLITTVHKKGYLARLPRVEPLPPDAAVRPPAEPALPAAPVLSATSSAPRAVAGSFNPAIARRPLLLVVLLLLVMLASVWAWLQRPPPAATAMDDPPYTLAVLPFVDLSENADNAWLADGLAEELLGLLGRFSDFRVAARSSSFLFRDPAASPREVGTALGVRYLVEGSVRRDADQVRVDVRLVETDSGFQVWAESYARGLAGLFALQSDIATKVARTLQVVLVESEQAGTRAREDAGLVGGEAYLEYLRARQLNSSWATDDLEAAALALQNAIALAPDFAPAYAQLAEVMLIQASRGGGEQGPPKRELAATLVEKALQLDPDLAPAYTIRAGLYRDPRDPAVEADLRRSIALNPSYPKAYEILAQRLFASAERRQEALQLIDQARALDPLRARLHHVKTYMTFDLCQLDAAEDLARQALRVNPRFPASLVMLGHINSWRGELAEAVKLQEQALAMDPDSIWTRQHLHNAYLVLGEREAARQVDDSSARSLWAERLLLEGPASAGELVYGSDAETMRRQLGPWSETYSVLAAAIDSGDFAPARSHIEERFGFDGGLPEHIDPAELTALVNMVLIWFGGSLDQRGLELMQDLDAEMARQDLQAPNCLQGHMPLARALAATALGEPDRALGLLREGEQRNRLAGGWYRLLEVQPAFAALVAHPEFTALQRDWEQRLADQRAQLAQLRENGRIPDRRAAPPG